MRLLARSKIPNNKRPEPVNALGVIDSPPGYVFPDEIGIAKVDDANRLTAPLKFVKAMGVSPRLNKRWRSS